MNTSLLSLVVSLCVAATVATSALGAVPPLMSLGYQCHESYDGTGFGGCTAHAVQILDTGNVYEVTVQWSIYDPNAGAIVSACFGVDGQKLAGTDFYNGNPPVKPGVSNTYVVTVPKASLSYGSRLILFFDWNFSTVNYSVNYRNGWYGGPGIGFLPVAVALPPLASNQTFVAPFDSAPVTVDGVLSWSEWSNASASSISIRSNDGTNQHAATMLVKHDGTWLYVGVVSGYAATNHFYWSFVFDGNHSHTYDGNVNEPHVDVGISTPCPIGYGYYDRYDAQLATGAVAVTPPVGTAKAADRSDCVWFEHKVKIADLGAAAGSVIGFYFQHGDASASNSYGYPSVNAALASWPHIRLAEEGLIAYYPFNGNANDESGNGYHGTVHDATLALDRYGNADRAYQFDGINDWIGASGDSLTSCPCGTVSLFIKTEAYMNRVPLSKGTVALTDFIVAFGVYNEIVISMGGAYGASTTNIPSNVWTHVALTWNGGSWQIFVNGELDTQIATSGTPLNNINELKIGCHYHPSGTMYYQGSIDDVRIYNRVLPANEIEALAGMPAVPTTISASDGTYTNKVSVTWNMVSNATKYALWRNTSSSTNTAANISGDITTTNYDDTTITLGQTYWYWAKAGNAGGWSDFSAGDSGYVESAADIGTNWVVVGNMVTARCQFTATLLSNGKVLIAGGSMDGGVETPSCELFDPATGTSTLAAPMQRARNNHAAMMLGDGRIMVVGGAGPGGEGATRQFRQCEIYDPVSNTWSNAANLINSSQLHGLETLDDGTIIKVCGATLSGFGSSVCEIYVPASNTWFVTGSTTIGHQNPGVVKMANGEVIVAGGYMFNDYVEVYSPTSGLWTTVGHMTHTVSDIAAAQINDGRVFFIGGVYWDGSHHSYPTVDAYVPSSRSVTSGPDMLTPRAEHRVLKVADGDLLAIGGYYDSTGHSTNACERFVGSQNAWLPAPHLNNPRRQASVLYIQENAFVFGGFRCDATTNVVLRTVERLHIDAFSTAPAGVAASDGSYTNKVAVTWSASSNATKYVVFRNTINDSGSAVAVSPDVPTNACEDFAVTPGVTYYYWVKAGNINGWSGFSAGDSGYAGTGVSIPTVSPTSLNFLTNLVSQFTYLGNAGTLPFSFTATVVTGGAWLSVDPGSGTLSNQSIALSCIASRAGLSNGTYFGTISIVTSVGTTLYVQAQMVVSDNAVVAEANGPYSVNQGSPAMLTAAGSQGSMLLYRWEVGLDFISGYSSNYLGFTFTNTFVPQTMDVILTVRDTNSPPHTASDSTTLTILNVPPTVDLAGPYAGNTVTALVLTASVTDPGISDTFLFRWDFNGDGSWDTGWIANGTTSHLYAAAGSYVAACEAMDNYGGVGADSAVILVAQPNLPPVATAVVHGTTINVTNLPGLGLTVSMSGSGSLDPDNKPFTNLFFDWREDVANPQKPVTYETNRHDAILTTMPLTQPGEYKFHLVVCDGEYNSQPATVTVLVPGWRGEVICEGFIAKVPLWGVEATVTNAYTHQMKSGRSDTNGIFLADSGRGYQIALLSRNTYTKQISVDIDADGTFTENIYFPPRYFIYAGNIVTGTPGQYVGLDNAHVGVLIGNGLTSPTDLSGGFGFGSVPETWPLDGDQYTIRFQKTGVRSRLVVMPLTMNRNSETILMEPSAGTIEVRGTVVTEGLPQPLGGVVVDFGLWSATTASNGAFGPITMPDGTYAAVLTRQGYEKTMLMPLTLAPGTTNLTLTMLGGRVSAYGEIVNGAGAVVTNATITMVASGGGGRRAGATTGEYAATGAGYYDVLAAKGEQCVYEVSAPGYQPQQVALDMSTHKKQNVVLVPEPAAAGSLLVICYSLLVGRRKTNARRIRFI